jgi:oxygen-independent coproporphyrinogen-3 oxidase
MEDYSSSAKLYDIDSVYIGGGTPTVIPRDGLSDLIDGVYDNFYLTADAEFSIEANPATVDAGMLRKLRKLGVNRLSIGMQSANDNELAALGRVHKYDDFMKSYSYARGAGFDNINVDIMYGIPEQTEISFHNTLERVCEEIQPEHISLYGLKIEENTPFHDIAASDSFILPNEDTEYVMYMTALRYLAQMGYKQYEISNFAKPGMECKHNLKYWNCEDYLGLGPSAHSYYNGYRFSFKRDVETYVEALENVSEEFDLTDECYEITASERVGEYVMLRMRLCDGINTDTFYKLFGLDFNKLYGKYLEKYMKKEHPYLIKRENNYSFTPDGMYISNYILSDMLDFSDSSIAKIMNGVN